MSRDPLTVVIPTRNRPGPLAELFESLARQTYLPLKIVVLNGGSAPVEELAGRYPELDVTLVDWEPGWNHVDARNFGVSLAPDGYVMLCDDDDLLVSGHVERMMRGIGRSDLAYSDVEIFDYVPDVQGVRQPTRRFLFAYENDPVAMRRFSTFVASGCLCRRALWERLGPFDREMDNYWDWDFYLRAAAAGRVRRVPVAGVLYAFSPLGDNMSLCHASQRASLDRLSAKHGLGPLPTANFFTLLDEPEVARRRAKSEVVWDGKPFSPRLSRPDRTEESRKR